MMEWGVTEVCPHCESENFYAEYDAEKLGYVQTCQHCGRQMMLCDACLHADDNAEQRCDWHKERHMSVCFRGTHVMAGGSDMENKQKALDCLLAAINETNRNDAQYNHIVALDLIERKNCRNMFGQELPDGEYVRVRWSNNPNRDDGYYDINVNGDNAFGVLIDTMNWLDKRL